MYRIGGLNTHFKGSMIMTSPCVRPIFLDLEIDGIKEDNKPLPNIRQFGAWDPKRSEPFMAAIAIPKKPGQADPAPNFNSRYPEPQRYSMNVVWEEFKKWALKDLPNDSRIVLVAHNGYEHDKPILDAALLDHNITVSKDWKWFDTLWLAGMLLPEKNKGLQALREHYGIEFQGAHTAAIDAHVLAQVFFKMIGEAEPEEVYQAMLSPHPIKDTATVIRTHKTATLIFFDIESTGLIEKDVEGNECYPRIVELAAYAPYSDKEHKRYSFLVNPEMKIPAEAVAVHHITNEMVANAPTIKKALEEFSKFLAYHTPENGIPILIAHNCWGFDKKVLENEYDRAGMRRPIANYYDTLPLIRNLHKGHKHSVGNGFFKLQEQRKLYGIAENDAHRAMGDVMVLNEWFNRLVDTIDPRKVSKAMLSSHPVLNLGKIIANEHREGIICPPPTDAAIGQKRKRHETFAENEEPGKRVKAEKAVSSSSSTAFTGFDMSSAISPNISFCSMRGVEPAPAPFHSKLRVPLDDDEGFIVLDTDEGMVEEKPKTPMKSSSSSSVDPILQKKLKFQQMKKLMAEFEEEYGDN